MNLNQIKLFKIGDVVSVLLNYPISAELPSMNTRIGRIKEITENILVLEPHKNKTILNIHGLEIVGEFTILDISNIFEIMKLKEEQNDKIFKTN